MRPGLWFPRSSVTAIKLSVVGRVSTRQHLGKTERLDGPKGQAAFMLGGERRADHDGLGRINPALCEVVVLNLMAVAPERGLAPTLVAVRNKLDQPLALGYCQAGVALEVGIGVSGFRAG